MINELIVETLNPKALDKTISYFGGLVEQDENGNYVSCGQNCYKVRSISNNVDFIRFAIKNQGYGKIINKKDI